ncbi:class III poly(R)-hydroxyalkanoic acid synthase subunit PhaC [Motiliproteus sp. MSK22-1]|uniref:class III poly(R)-hydroxyalkanoic acid synthase subunit PhaC n=1 Tax=Motiliproteus sp. MSK22-1 TaxID=1897630 RepID=UPI0009775D31|nr:class III poly(R)-hydroxyalkanoic acid synthase subunit PhaC [Motiliproteus sp. MSK22-1]OMH38711.1 class III poly(R)-hydroxyalkanoic acid synthase subunit PhaC [Motiliproteus sp. MSK22-1]
MNNLNLKPTEIARELLEFNSRMLKSLDTLANVSSIEVGSTANSEIYREDKLRLLYYPAESSKQKQAPLLIVYALVNRPYILDLQPGRSLIQSLTQRGIPIYLIDWGYPDSTDQFLDLDDYINGYLQNCVSKALEHSSHSRINLLGVCQGGTFSLCYTAINPNEVASLITMVTPVDFHTPDNTLTQLIRTINTELAIEIHGNFPGEVLTQAYNSLLPVRLGLEKQLGLPMQLENYADALNFLRMERWIHDSPDLAGKAFKEFLTNFFEHNRFLEGGLNIGEKAVDLKKIHQPVLNLFAAKDHLVPPQASRALKQLTSSRDYQEKQFNGGHIGIFVGKQSQKKLPDLIAKWLIDHE